MGQLLSASTAPAGLRDCGLGVIPTVAFVIKNTGPVCETFAGLSCTCFLGPEIAERLTRVAKVVVSPLCQAGLLRVRDEQPYPQTAHRT